MDTSATALNQAMAAELRAERAAADLTLEEVVELSGVSLSTLRRILKGTVDVNVADLGAIAAAYNTKLEKPVTPQELVRRAVTRAGGFGPLSVAADSNVIQLRPKKIEDMSVEEIESIQEKAAYRDPEADEDEHFD